MINEMQPLKFENIMIMQEWNSDLHTHRILLTCNLAVFTCTPVNGG